MESTPSPPLLSLLRAASIQSAAPARRSVHPNFCIVALAGLAFLCKIVIALNTMGTNDVVAFYTFARSLADHGLAWTYQNGVVWFSGFPVFNHSPLVAYFIQFIDRLARQPFFIASGFTFPFLLRLPGIIADFVVVLLLVRLRSTTSIRIPTWALLLFAISPVSLMVSGFHGNSDPVMLMFLLLACVMAVHDRPLFCGLLLALSVQIKMVPLLLFPIFFFFWGARRQTWRFLIPFVATSLICVAEPLLNFPALYLRNVLSYGSYWGLWGITYWLRLTGYRGFDIVSFYHLPIWETIVLTALKILIAAAVFAIAWRRRKLDGVELMRSCAYAWIVFFVFAPGISPQYMIWLAPFVLLLSPHLYAYLAASSSLFLFFFYNVTAGGLPWYVAVSRNNMNMIWTPWSLWPWAVLLLGMIWLWQRAVSNEPSFRLLSLSTLAKSPA
jgi:uncharacterized membrane protein